MVRRRAGSDFTHNPHSCYRSADPKPALTAGARQLRVGDSALYTGQKIGLTDHLQHDAEILRAFQPEARAMSEIIQVTTTTDQRAVAETIAETLLAERLAACVTIGGPVHSVYRWQGRRETAEEWTCTAKTVRRLYTAVETRLRAVHNYQEPEILVTDVTGGSASYLDWLRAQVADPPPQHGPGRHEPGTARPHHGTEPS